MALALTPFNSFAKTRPGKPDLKITSSKVISRTSTSVTFEYTVTNLGDYMLGSLNDIQIMSYYSKDAIFNNYNDSLAGQQLIGVRRSLFPGESYTGTITTGVFGYHEIPQEMNYLTFKVDSSNKINESEENNNFGVLSINADLIFTNFKITNKTSTKIYYQYTIKNVGGNNISDLSKVKIGNEFSTDRIYGISGYFSDIDAGSMYINSSSSLDVGESYSGVFYAEADYRRNYLVCKIDADNVIREGYGYESNNTVSVWISEEEIVR